MITLSEDEVALIRTILIALRAIKVQDIDKALVILSMLNYLAAGSLQLIPASSNGINKFSDRCTAVSYTLFGRRRRWSGKPRLTELLNHPVQGLNADIIKLALIKLQKPLARLNAMLIGVIHNELLIECPAAVSDRVCQSVVRQMVKIAEPFLQPTPVVVNIICANSWGEDLELESE